MTGAVMTLALNILITVLLGVTIAYCWVLNRRIKALQDSRGELALLLKHFDESTLRASESIIALQTASKKIGENIQFRIDKANYLLDDLGFMIEKGNKLANQMEAGFAVNRARNRAMNEPPPTPPLEEVIETFEPEFVATAPTPRAPEKSAPARDKTAATLEAVLERVVGRSAARPAPVEPERPVTREKPATRPRSRAEQELLDMIKAGMKG